MTLADELRALANGLSSPLQERIATLADRVAELERDCKQGWDNFYATRKQLAELQYPGLTNEVKVADAARKGASEPSVWFDPNSHGRGGI